AAAGLDSCELLRIIDVTDVEDPDTAETLLTDRVANARGSAINSAPCLLHRHEQEIAIDGHVSLPTRANHRRNESRLRGIFDRIHREPIEVAHDRVIVSERQVGIRKIKSRRWHCRSRSRATLTRIRWARCRRGGWRRHIGRPIWPFGRSWGSERALR